MCLTHLFWWSGRVGSVWCSCPCLEIMLGRCEFTGDHLHNGRGFVLQRMLIRSRGEQKLAKQIRYFCVFHWSLWCTSKYNTANIRPWFFFVGEWEVLHQVGKGLAGWGSPRRSRSAFRYLSQNMLEDVANRLKCALPPWQKKRWKVWPFHRILDQVPGSFILPCHPDWKFIIFSYTIVLTLRSISHLTLFKQIPMYPHTLYPPTIFDIICGLALLIWSAIIHCCYPPLIVLFHKSIFHFHNKEPQQKERSKVAPVNPIEGSCLPYLLYGSPEIWKALWVSCCWCVVVVVGLDVQRRRSVIKFDCELKANDS